MRITLHTEDGGAGGGTSGTPASTTVVAPVSSSPPQVPFGKQMRALFEFHPDYTPLNHGSYGTFPAVVRKFREASLHEHEERPDTFRRFTQPEIIKKSRAAVAPLLGPDVHVDEVVFQLNATTGVNTVVHNLAGTWSASAGDAVLHFSTIYGACRKTLLSLEEVGRLRTVEVHMSFPADSDDDLDAKLRATHARAVEQGLTPRLVVIDTIVSGPGVLMPWQRLVATARELGMQSLIDGAHGIGHIDLTELGSIKPDFFVTNLHKWLFVPRGCALLYVPFRNQHQITTSLPTSWGYQLPGERDPSRYFPDLFADLGTSDMSPYACVETAMAFRRDVCGGEATIREYCVWLAREGGDRAAAILGTDVMDNPNSNIRQCNFANVRLPLSIKPDAEIAHDDTTSIPLSCVAEVADWIQMRGVLEGDTYLQAMFYDGIFWTRFSAQIYLDIADFEWGARQLVSYCERVRAGEWKK